MNSKLPRIAHRNARQSNRKGNIPMPWDSTMRVKEKKDDATLARIICSHFESGDTKDGIKYSIGGLYVREYVRYVSKEAWKLIADKDQSAVDGSKGVEYSKLKVRDMQVTREHVIPVAVVYDHLKEKYDAGLLTKEYIMQIMPKLFLAVITRDENGKLSKYKSSIPGGKWQPFKYDPLSRYEKSELGDIWVKSCLPRRKKGTKSC